MTLSHTSDSKFSIYPLHKLIAWHGEPTHYNTSVSKLECLPPPSVSDCKHYLVHWS